MDISQLLVNDAAAIKQRLYVQNGTGKWLRWGPIPQIFIICMIYNPPIINLIYFHLRMKR